MPFGGWYLKRRKKKEKKEIEVSTFRFFLDMLALKC